MNTNKHLDVRGLSCPEPAMRTRMMLNAISSGTIEILVDSGTAQDNITRIAQQAGWEIKTEKLSQSEMRMILSK
ncbi:MAG: sulfurtransferase TusA family protein [bacterium]